MTMKNLFRDHPDKFLILLPLKRDKKTGFCKGWKVLKRAESAADVADAVGFYEKEGFADAVAFSTAGAGAHPDHLLPPDMAAKFFRMYFGDGCGGSLADAAGH